MRKLKHKLNLRKTENSLRVLSTATNLVDFYSNDYLGFSRDFKDETITTGGATGSRLISGNYSEIEALESYIADYHKAAAALLYNSGFDANLGLLSCIADRHDAFFVDALCHASIYDGTRLSFAKTLKFEHNNTNNLIELLKKSTAEEKYVVVESVYSMDGDLAPLKKLVEICEQYRAKLIVDEAHAVGLFGVKGEGRVVELDLKNKVFARVITYGKAMGLHGASVLGSQDLKSFLINFSRPFIFSTGTPKSTVFTLKKQYDKLSVFNISNLKFIYLISLFKEKVKQCNSLRIIEGETPILAVVIPGNDRVKAAVEAIKKAGFNVKEILSPTVPKGTERIRICFHEFNTEEEVIALANAFLLHFQDSLQNSNI